MWSSCTSKHLCHPSPEPLALFTVFFWVALPVFVVFSLFPDSFLPHTLTSRLLFEHLSGVANQKKRPSQWRCNHLARLLLPGLHRIPLSTPWGMLPFPFLSLSLCTHTHTAWHPLLALMVHPWRWLLLLLATLQHMYSILTPAHRTIRPHHRLLDMLFSMYQHTHHNQQQHTWQHPWECIP